MKSNKLGYVIKEFIRVKTFQSRGMISQLQFSSTEVANDLDSNSWQ